MDGPINNCRTVFWDRTVFWERTAFKVPLPQIVREVWYPFLFIHAANILGQGTYQGQRR
jgi:hypothetical protein